MRTGLQKRRLYLQRPGDFRRVRDGRGRRLPRARHQTVAVTAGYIHDEPRRDFYAKMDAANVDLKAFTEEFYFKLTGSHLQPVLDTLCTSSTRPRSGSRSPRLLIPGKNDSDEEITPMCRWIARELGTDVPLHFTAFHPGLQDERRGGDPGLDADARAQIALREGLSYVYTGNVHDTVGGTTFCPACKEELIVRDWHQILRYHLTGDGRCLSCGAGIPGRFQEFKSQFGRQRIPVRLSAFSA